jgi:predicted metalloprotease
MKWEDQERSRNVEDRRGGGMGGGGRGPRIGGRGVGLGTIVIALVAGWVFGINPLTVLGLLGGADGGAPTQISQPGPAPAPPAQDQMAQFVSTVLRDTEMAWDQVFAANGQRYQPPKLVLYRGRTPTACGTGDAAMGPFYCPGDQKVYLDLDFFDTLSRRMNAPGDFAQAYVIAHEVGHHVQNLLGITGKVDAMRGRVSTQEMNALSVRVELQADCFAGVWARLSQQRGGIRYEPGDFQEGLNAAAQIGDDMLQKQSRGVVVPESFTHGSSQQRMAWFKRGLDSGSVQQCNSFEARQL